MKQKKTQFDVLVTYKYRNWFSLCVKNLIKESIIIELKYGKINSGIIRQQYATRLNIILYFPAVRRTTIIFVHDDEGFLSIKRGKIECTC